MLMCSFFNFVRYFKRWCSMNSETFPSKNLYVSHREFHIFRQHFTSIFNYAYITVIISATLMCILKQTYKFVLQIHMHACYIIK